MTARLLLLIPLFLVTGCGRTYWYNPQATIDEARTDWLECHDGLLDTTFDGARIKKELVLDYYRAEGAECMRQKGYYQVRARNIPDDVQVEKGSRGFIDYELAGRPTMMGAQERTVEP